MRKHLCKICIKSIILHNIIRSTKGCPVCQMFYNIKFKRHNVFKKERFYYYLNKNITNYILRHKSSSSVDGLCPSLVSPSSSSLLSKLIICWRRFERAVCWCLRKFIISRSCCSSSLCILCMATLKMAI